MTNNRPSIIEYYSKQESNCGYCTGKNKSFTYGLHGYIMRVEDYQNMVDRGWRRCGDYFYKAIMDSYCCPLYTIRCAAKDFKLSRSQKKIIKKFNNFLITGKISKDKGFKGTDVGQSTEVYHAHKDGKAVKELMSLDVSKCESFLQKNDADVKISSDELKESLPKAPKMTNAPLTKEPNSKKMNKARYLRIERKKEKLQKLGLTEEEIAKKLVEKKRYPVVKTIEDRLNETTSKNKVHNLRISLVRSSPKSEEFHSTFEASFDLYKLYQTFIHKVQPEKLTKGQFERFLVVSPLQATKGYGSYHQQYWLDDKLIAVGVIDILPKCVSSVYFYYHPEFSHLFLGTYGALREIEFTRKLSRQFPELIYYYMGFYIHSCVKMKYKGSFSPSFLLCPEVFSWHPIKECLPKLEISKYSRLNEDPLATDSNSNVSFFEILVLYNKTAMPLSHYLAIKNCDDEELEEIMEYAKLVGKSCAGSMLLYRP